MIQPINVISPRVGFKGKDRSYAKQPAREKTKKQMELLNAVGLSAAAGAVTTAASRGYTSSWSHAGVIGICGMVLSMFFLAPFLIDNSTLLKSSKKNNKSGAQAKEAINAETVREAIRPAKKLVQFRQQA